MFTYQTHITIHSRTQKKPEIRLPCKSRRFKTRQLTNAKTNNRNNKRAKWLDTAFNMHMTTQNWNDPMDNLRRQKQVPIFTHEMVTIYLSAYASASCTNQTLRTQMDLSWHQAVGDSAGSVQQCSQADYL